MSEHNDEKGALECPGGRHPNTPGQLCCDACWERVPTNLPDWPRWRSRLAAARRSGGYGWFIAERIHDAVKAWLSEYPRVIPPGKPDAEAVGE